jgi:hypothetical protein
VGGFLHRIQTFPLWQQHFKKQIRKLLPHNYRFTPGSLFPEFADELVLL